MRNVNFFTTPVSQAVRMRSGKPINVGNTEVDTHGGWVEHVFEISVAGLGVLRDLIADDGVEVEFRHPTLGWVNAPDAVLLDDYIARLSQEHA